MRKNLTFDIHKLIGTVLIGAYFVYCAKYPQTWHLIDNFDLIIHEAGHTIFGLFGEFASILGGSLFQVLIPLIFIGYFFFKRDYFSASALTPWLGYNLVNISVYIRDAIIQVLPLLGGDSVIHDWNWLLSTTGLLSKTYVIASIVNGLGLLLTTIGIMASLYFSKKA